jgi:hypothetical protein
MPSSYTPSLRLVLPVTGELQGTWGQTVNNGLTNLVDAAIAGTATVAMPDSNYVLTAVNEGADEARQMFIRLTGTLTAPRNVICPAVSKLYFVTNDTNDSIVFKTASGTGVTVPTGRRMMLACNGTNVIEAVNLTSALVTGATTANSLSAGIGLTGASFNGSAAVSIALGTPSTLNSSTTNSVSGTTHTHAVTFPVTSVNGQTGAVSVSPNTLTTATTNSVVGSLHTHQVVFPVTSVNGQIGDVVISTGGTPNALTMNSGGAGAASGTTFDGSVARTISYNTIGAPSVTGTNASGTWSISVTGNAATATTLQTARTINGVSFNGSANISILANTTNSVSFNNGGSGGSSGSAFNGSSAIAVSYNTIGAMGVSNSETVTGSKTFNAATFINNSNTTARGLAVGVSSLPSNEWNAYFRGQTGHPASVHFTNGSNGTSALFAVNSTSGTSFAVFNYGDPASVSSVIGSIATITGTSVSYNTTSDYRLKEDVVPLEGAADRVLQLNPVRFRWKGNPGYGLVDGFLAHEVTPVVHEAVSGEKDAVNPDGSIKPQGIDQSKLVPLLTAALQEALVRIAALEARLND